jgi:hypothetical protein
MSVVKEHMLIHSIPPKKRTLLKPIALKGVAMNKPNQSITGIAEIALRVHDLDLMRRFYEQVIGLEVLREIKDSNGTIIFYAVGAGNDHLALFEEHLVPAPGFGVRGEQQDPGRPDADPLGKAHQMG